jgi:hypothetical protein
MGEHTRVGLSADRIVALISALLMVGVGINRLILGSSADNAVWIILFSIVSIILGVFLIIVLNVFEVEAFKKIPYGLWILALVSVVLVLICILGYVYAFIDLFILPTILMICATVINFTSEKQSYAPSKIVIIAGAVLACYESGNLFVTYANQGVLFVGAVILGMIAILLAAILILSMTKIKIPFAWWLVLMIGFVYFWIFQNFFSFTWASGIIVLVGFILMIFAY